MLKEEVKNFVEKSLLRLIEKDKEIIDKRVKEECINHRFACYLEEILKDDSYIIDLEYDKSLDNPAKEIGNGENKKAIRPDIIIHKRDTHERNLIAFEVKKYYTTKHDEHKIRWLMREPYKYTYGCLISYLPENDYVILKLLYEYDV